MLQNFFLGRLRKWPLFRVSERCVNTSEIQALEFLPWEPFRSVLKFSDFSVRNSVVYLQPRFEENGEKRGNWAPESATKAGKKVTLYHLEPSL